MASVSSNFEMDPSLMRDLRHALTSSHAQNHQRTPVSSIQRKWNGRIEKSCSTHTSPAREGRHRAWSGVSHIQQFVPTISQGVNQQMVHPMLAEHQRAQRPLSWHATSYPMPSYTSSPTNLATEQYPTSHADFAPRTYTTTYPSYETYGYSMNPTAMPGTPSSTLVYPNASPIWQDDNNSNQYMINNYPQTYHIPISMDTYHQPINTETVDHPFKQDTQTYYSSFSSFHPEPRIVSEDYELGEEEEEEEGEVLVALGLYDDVVDRTLQHPMKLTETWTPPPSESVQSDTDS